MSTELSPSESAGTITGMVGWLRLAVTRRSLNGRRNSWFGVDCSARNSLLFRGRKCNDGWLSAVVGLIMSIRFLISIMNAASDPCFGGLALSRL